MVTKPQSDAVLKEPRTDEARVWEIILPLWSNAAILVAHDLKLYEYLGGQPRTVTEICDSLGIKQRPASALLSISAALGIVKSDQDRFSLTDFGEDYFVSSSPTYFGGIFDLTAMNSNVWSFEGVRKAVLTNSPQAYGGADIFDYREIPAEQARNFTRAMHSQGMASALKWPGVLDLSKQKTMLDVGGGSGAFSVTAVIRWPNLNAIVFDLEPVCEVALEVATKYELTDRISSYAGDLWSDPYPNADLHFYSNVFHDWPPERCRFLLAKSFDSLPGCGRLVIHEILFNDDRTGPFAAASFNVEMLCWILGQQYSGKELIRMLQDSGFVDVEVHKCSSLWSLVTGKKPS
ncbi:MAG TPA: methyltransferase [Candidatus Binataceae bacterium]|nr:methyltransferase [Candidatus Binataceae bacterium]